MARISPHRGRCCGFVKVWADCASMLRVGKRSFSTTVNLLPACEKSVEKFLQRQDIGFSKLPARRALLEESQKWGTLCRARYTDMVIVGIGGSALGPRVLADLFELPMSKHHLHF